MRSVHGIHGPGQPVQFRLGDRWPAARETFQKLKDRKILVRLMSYPGYPEGLRITVGTEPRSTGSWRSWRIV